MKYLLFKPQHVHVPFLLLSLSVQTPLIYSSTSTGVSTDSGTNYNDNDALYCTQGFGTNKHKQIKIKIEPDQINDGYCDCPFENGIDEPGTDACSGSTHWAGINVYDNSDDYDVDDDLPKVTCPQQPNIKLSLSKINDSICDCCDGYDESQNSQNNNNLPCPDICDVVLAKEREIQKELRSKYIIGSKKRSQIQTEYDNIMNDKHNQIDKLLHDKIPKLEHKIHENLELAKGHKLEFWNLFSSFMNDQYEKNGSDVLADVVGGVESGELNQKLKQALFSICQLYGELVADSKTKGDSHASASPSSACLPLQLAGLDNGLLWKSTNNSYVTLETVDDGDDLKATLATLLLNNHDHHGKRKYLNEVVVDWNDGNYDDKISTSKHASMSIRAPADIKERKEKRKYSGIDDDEDDEDLLNPEEDDYYGGFDRYDDDDDDYDHDHDHDHDQAYDDFISEYNEKRNDDMKTQSKDANEASNDILSTAPTNSDDNGKTRFHSSLGQLLRHSFYEHAKSIIHEIDSLLDDSDNGNADEDEDEDILEEEPKISIDPMAMTMVRNALNHNIHLIENGNQIAESASRFIQVLEKQLGDAQDHQLLSLSTILKKLVVGTMYHSNLYDADIAEVLALVNIMNLEEGVLQVPSDDEKTCFDWYYTLCNQEMSSQLIEDRCKERSNKNANISCTGTNTADSNSNDVVESTISIPSHISDGYYNFYMTKQREGGDYFVSKLYQNIEPTSMKEIFKNSYDVSKIEDGISFAKRELTNMHKKADSLRNEIGDKDKYGPDGTLYAIRDECFEVVANKYIYELCMFGKARQRDSHAKKGTGTDLGSWNSNSVEEETGSLVFKWKDGQKCWNGPKRSATVFVSCGTENKLISADEPNICEYVFKMESFVACDDAFKKLHNIQV